MPITAKLSNKFYEKLGDDVANELVEWLNLVDTSYRQEFKDLFEASFGRVEARLQAMEARFEAKLAGVKSELRTDFVERLAKTQSSLILWMFGFWTANVLATGGLVLGAVALLKH